MKAEVQLVQSSCQFVHCRVNDSNGVFNYWLTAVYAHKQLDKRKTLWKEIERIHKIIIGPWCMIGDFNNVSKAQDRIGGNLVTEKEYIDMQSMMMKTGLSEMDSSWIILHGSLSTLLTPFYSRIDRLIGNVDWFQSHLDVSLTILPLCVSDHALLHVSNKTVEGKPKRQSRFSNCLVEMAGIEEVVHNSWRQSISGTPMMVLWEN